MEGESQHASVITGRRSWASLNGQWRKNVCLTLSPSLQLVFSKLYWMIPLLSLRLNWHGPGRHVCVYTHIQTGSGCLSISTFWPNGHFITETGSERERERGRKREVCWGGIKEGSTVAGLPVKDASWRMGVRACGGVQTEEGGRWWRDSARCTVSLLSLDMWQLGTW